jgi:tetratricopeptide (TPR) repeat protein
MRVLIAALAAATLTASAATANEYAFAQAGSLFRQLSDDGQCEAALPSARTFWRSSDFRTLAPEAQAAFLFALSNCAWRMEDGQLVIASAREAHALGATWSDYLMLQAGVRFDDDRAAIEGFHALAQSDAETLRAMPWRFAWGALGAANDLDASGAEALRIHAVLEEQNYAPAEGGFTDGLRVAHARLLLKVGQVERARQQLEPVVEPREVITLRVERAFDALRGDAALERRLDVIAAAEAHLARTRDVMEQRPKSLSAVLDHAQALRTLRRNEEALALLERHIAVAQGADGAQRYDDLGNQLNWLLNERAYALYDLNRADEARAALGESIAVAENGEWNVSQVINFASMLVAEGRGADAIEVVSTVGRASQYGDMWVAFVRACAGEQTGNTALRDEAMNFMREHPDDNPAAITRAYLCINDLDGAAAMYVSRLNDEDQRSDALIALQRFLDDAPALPHNAVLLQRLEQVRARADVLAAVDAVGRIEDVPLHSVYWGGV